MVKWVGVSAAEQRDNSIDIQLMLFPLIPFIKNNVNECLDLSYNGKLLMQNDLDVIVAKFDSHVKFFFGIFVAGILSHGFVIVVSKPSLGACKEDMRFYVRDLLTRMKIGDTEMKRQALGNLYQDVDDDERC
ncbi:hypothetical protein F3Y22_tig00110777pilonHSYRG00160 [Hibiscus syriacus]|uniref:DUF7032 domain-containing protein n=1 Tax=Hibiscus syriacus TaxID=106335 RepID=A0A6A2ZS73_HIBSY|nr:hypothetical protein F3Y22_tig00110777pilonHSYRG00160 [Hibiscus syriacus]